MFMLGVASAWRNVSPPEAINACGAWRMVEMARKVANEGFAKGEPFARRRHL
jgi:hypothetical protein